MMAFDTIQQATKLWIKGREFTISKLLGLQYAHEAPRYNGGSLVIFRLAPQVIFHCCSNLGDNPYPFGRITIVSIRLLTE